VRLYRLSLQAYPGGFRRRHGAEMVRMFAEDWRAARQAGPGAVLAYAAHIISDLARTVPPERFGALTFDGCIAGGTATFCGATAAWVDGQAGEAPATALVLAAGAAGFSYFAEKRTWRWPVAAAAWLPGARLAGFALGLARGSDLMLTPPPPGLPAPALWLLALLASFAGVATGTRLRRLLPPCCDVRPGTRRPA
jgi:hypothetical protein